MNKDQTIVIFGANGKMGSLVVKQALEAGYQVKAFIRSPEKYDLAQHLGIEVVRGDATVYEDVEKAIQGADIVISCLGNPPKSKVLIMATAYENIMKAAAEQRKSPRCIMISSIGLGGSSWFVRVLLTMIAGKKSITDFENADQCVREEVKVPFVLVRASGLTDKAGKRTYRVLEQKSVFWPKFISRSDVAKFFVDCLDNTQYDRKAIMLVGK
jgi:putative NADH-flavin reductase